MNKTLFIGFFVVGLVTGQAVVFAADGQSAMGGDGFYVMPFKPPAPPPAAVPPSVSPWVEPAATPPLPAVAPLSPQELASPWVPNMSGGALPGEVNNLPPTTPLAPPPEPVSAAPLAPPVPPAPPPAAKPAPAANLAQTGAPTPPSLSADSNNTNTMPGTMIPLGGAATSSGVATSATGAPATTTATPNKNTVPAEGAKKDGGNTAPSPATPAIGVAKTENKKPASKSYEAKFHDEDELREFTKKMATWHAQQGQTLDEVLGDWADKAGWTLVFNSKMIYELQASANFDGDFISAATALIKSVRAEPTPLAVFFRGNKTLVVSNHSDQEN